MNYILITIWFACLFDLEFWLDGYFHQLPENYKSAKYYSLYTHSKIVCSMYAVLHGSPCHYCIGMRRRFFLKRQVRPLLHTYTSLEVHSMYYIAQSEGRSLCNVQCKSKGKTDAAKLSYNKSKDLCKPLHTVSFHNFLYDFPNSSRETRCNMIKNHAFKLISTWVND